MRALRVAVDLVQFTLPELEPARPVERWWSLPEATRLEVLTLLSRLIARGVLIGPDVTVDEDRRGDE